MCVCVRECVCTQENTCLFLVFTHMHENPDCDILKVRGAAHLLPLATALMVTRGGCN